MTQAERIEGEEEAAAAAAVEKEKAHEQRKRAHSCKEYSSLLRRNKGNPVVIANALVIGLTSGLLGFGAYGRYSRGTLSWKVAGLATGVVGIFGTADYFVSKWFFQNKYPWK